jgi:transcriptional regulator with XRE-family HTH domain
MESSPDQKTREFGNKLREVRESRGFSKSDLSKRWGYCLSSISRIERGLINPPKLETLYKLFEVLEDLTPEEHNQLLTLSGRLKVTRTKSIGHSIDQIISEAQLSTEDYMLLSDSLLSQTKIYLRLLNHQEP